MPSVLTWSHVVFSRAGASILAELGVSQRTAFLVPYPHAAQDHQTANARAYIQGHKGWVEEEKNLTPEGMALILKGWLDKPEQLIYGEKNPPPTMNPCAPLYQFCTTS